MKKLIEKMVSIFLLSFLTISIFLILSVPVYSTEASDWKVVAESDWELVAERGDLKYYIDLQSIEEYTTCSCGDPPNRFIRAWIKTICNNPKQYEATEELDYQEHDCINGRSRLLHLTKFYPDGINESVNLDTVIKWKAIPSDAIAKFLHKYLCNKK